VRRWSVLLVGTFVLASQAAANFGLAVLAPVLRDHYGLSLTQVGLLLGGSSVGALLTLLPWGLAADRVGERTTATIGLVGAVGALAAAAYAPGFAALLALLFLMAAFAASTNTATGRAVTSWFARRERGFALGIRQTAIPLGGFAAAFAVSAIVDHWGLRTSLLALGGLLLVAAVVAAVFMVEGPVREVEDEADLLRQPLRDRRIWRISSGSSLLLVTQIAVTGFVVLFLESQRGFSHLQAGAVLAGINAVGAAGRLGSGRVSDGSRTASGAESG
jgi:sugar phosphate permease